MLFKKINILLLLVLLLFSCWKDEDATTKKTDTSKTVHKKIIANNKSDKMYSVWEYLSLLWWDTSILSDEFWTITSSWNLIELNKQIVKDDFKNINISVDKILKSINKSKNLNKQEKIKIQALKYTKAISILNEANYYNKTDKVAEANWILENIIKEYPYSQDDFLNNYYLWYTKEILKNYSWALELYNTWLNNVIDDTKKSIITNQIWHVYESKWDFDNAYSYYTKAYKLDVNNYSSTFNIARYFSKIGNYKEAKKFYEYSLSTKSKSLKSELCFSLSTLELESNKKSPNIDKSIFYAKKTIEYNDNYSMWYVALARWYYMLNDAKYDKEITNNLEIAIKLNPNWSDAYRYYSMYFLDKKALMKSQIYLDKSNDAIDKDNSLMDYQLISLKYLNDVLKIYITTSISNLNTKNELYTNDKLKIFIDEQLIRKNNWIYTSLSGDIVNNQTNSWSIQEVMNSLLEIDNTWSTQSSDVEKSVINLQKNILLLSNNNSARAYEIFTNNNNLASDSTGELLTLPNISNKYQTNTGTTMNYCGNFTSSWNTTWSDCEIQWIWSSNGTIACKQTPSFTENTSSCGTQKCTTIYTDWVATGTSCWLCNWCPADVVQPNIFPETKTISINLNNPNSSCTWLFANNSDTCTVSLTITWATNDDKPVTNWWINGNISTITDLSNQWSDRINGWWKALNFTYLATSGPIIGKWNIIIDWIKARSPFTTNNWKIWFKLWAVNMTVSNILYSFYKPLIASILSSNDDWNTWNASPVLFDLLNYKLVYENIWKANISNYVMENFTSKIQAISRDLELEYFSIDSSSFNKNWTNFSWKINTPVSNYQDLLKVWLQIERPIVTYSLWWEIVKYYLSETKSPNDIYPIKILGK